MRPAELARDGEAAAALGLGVEQLAGDADGDGDVGEEADAVHTEPELGSGGRSRPILQTVK